MTAVWLMRGEDGKRESAALLALALRESLGLAELPTMDRLLGGKPWFPEHPDIQFNVSHSGPFAMCGVGNTPVGVDIEWVRPRSERLPQYALSEEEFSWYQARGGLWTDFCTLWRPALPAS